MIDMTDLGTYIEHNGRPAVRFVRTYPHPIDRLWSAITDTNELSHWFPSTVRIELRAGGTVDFSGDPYMDDSKGTVLACDPPRMLAFSWGGDELHFTLDSVGEGQCRLTFINVLEARNTAARNGAGWQVCLAELDHFLAGEPSGGPHSESALPWQPIYDAYVAAGVPSGAEVPSAS
jgi:uncharacterized protein YndB with AHSA1/START domain